jgi:hypothetical protein
MNKTVYKRKDQGASLLKIASLIPELALRKLSFIARFALILTLFSWDSLATRPKLELEETPADFYTSGKCPCSTGTIEYSQELPSKHSLKMTSVKDQGPLGTCVSFATSASAEYYYKKRFSEAEFTVLAQTNKLGNRCEDGLFLGNALRVARQYGLVPESRFRYLNYVRAVALKNGIDINVAGWEDELRDQEDPKVCTMNDYNGTMKEFGIDLSLEGNPNSDYTDYRLNNLRVIHHVSKASQAQALYQRSTISPRELERRLGDLRISSSTFSAKAPASVGKSLEADLESVEKALCRGLPVVAALDVYQNCWDDPTAASDYQISMPKARAKVEGSHAIVIRGFDHERQLFSIKNSWGPDWGDDGFAKLPYAYLKKYSTELVATGAPRLN